MKIDSRERWVSTGIVLKAGRRYRLTATGTWKDASIATDANGYESVNAFQKATERLRRMPDARWFALVGAVERRNGTRFLIGKEKVIAAPADGELTCYANDLTGFYFNNSGSVTLEATPLD